VASHFILIAGAWHGSWCWQRVAPLLEARGFRVTTPELPGMGDGDGDADVREVTLATWAGFVADVVRAAPEPVVLVGHSRAGIVISQAAELVPERVRRLVYLSAYLLPAGRTMAAEARADVESLIAPNMIPADSGLTCALRPDVVREAFYGRCTDADAAWAKSRLRPEPLKPLVTSPRITSGGFGSVPRAYVECTADRAVTLASQRRMQSGLPCDPVFTLDTDHSPFLSAPAALADVLGRL
jgi:pimeloyl-ACP methyl ester carboxylesterase